VMTCFMNGGKSSASISLYSSVHPRIQVAGLAPNDVYGVGRIDFSEVERLARHLPHAVLCDAYDVMIVGPVGHPREFAIADHYHGLFLTPAILPHRLVLGVVLGEVGATANSFGYGP
jgi:hypothetical protein